MSLDSSLKIKPDSSGNRNVYTRAERFKRLLEAERWNSEKGVLGMPKVRVIKAAVKKKEAKAETAAGAEGAAAAPAAGAAGAAAAAPAKGAAAKKPEAGAKKPEAGAKKEAAKK